MSDSKGKVSYESIQPLGEKSVKKVCGNDYSLRREGLVENWNRKKSPLFICFIGIDGAGKTALTQRLVEEMAADGLQSKYVMGRFEAFKLLRPFLFGVKKTILSGKKTDISAEGTSTKRKIFNNRLWAKVWEFSVLLDYLIQITFKIRLPLVRGKSICSDRYIYDTVIDLAVDLDYSTPRMRKMLKNLFHIVPRPDLVFLIDLPEEIAYERNLPKRDNLPLEYLVQRRKLYLSLKDRPEITNLDGTTGLEELFKIVKGEIKRRCY